MPVLASELVYVRPQRDGKCRVLEHHRDHKGRTWPSGHRLELGDEEIVASFVADKESVDRTNRAYRDAKQAGDGKAMEARLSEVKAAYDRFQSSFNGLTVAAALLAEANMAARTSELSVRLKVTELEDAVSFIEGGGDPTLFARIDLTEAEYRKGLIERFVVKHVTEDRRFICRMADWITEFSADQISSALGTSLARGQAIRDRALKLRDQVCPLLVEDDGKVDV